MPSMPPHGRGKPQHIKFFEHQSHDMSRGDLEKTLKDFAVNINKDTFAINGHSVGVPLEGSNLIVKYERGPKGDFVFKIEIKWFEGSATEQVSVGDFKITS